MSLSAKTSVYAVIGAPVRHSRSPSIHNRLFAIHGVDAVYVALEVSPEAAPQLGAAIRTLGLAGCNLTLPHKLAVISALDLLTPEAQAAGAVNTVIREGARLVGHNTDAEGFVRGFEAEHGPLAGRRVLVLGAGGAGRAVAFGCLAAGAEVRVWNRDPRRAQEVVEALAAIAPGRIVIAPADCTRSGEVIVNATSASAAWDVLAHAPPSAEDVWVDLNYWQPPSPVFLAARSAGLATQDGLPMLAWQATLAFERFTGVSADGHGVLAALRAEEPPRIG